MLHVSVLLREILSFALKPRGAFSTPPSGWAAIRTRCSKSTRKRPSSLSIGTREPSNWPRRASPSSVPGRSSARRLPGRPRLDPPQSLCYAVADLGVSSLQLDDKDRGFSFRFDAPLDMRMDPRADGALPTSSTPPRNGRLERILTEFGEEPKARAIARSIVMERRTRSNWTTSAFASLVRRDAHGRPGLDPRLERSRRSASPRTGSSKASTGPRSARGASPARRPPGRHRVPLLEDRIVKNVFRNLKTSGRSSC